GALLALAACGLLTGHRGSSSQAGCPARGFAERHVFAYANVAQLSSWPGRRPCDSSPRHAFDYSTSNRMPDFRIRRRYGAMHLPERAKTALGGAQARILGGALVSKPA